MTDIKIQKKSGFKNQFSYYNDDEISNQLTWDELFPILEKALKQYSKHGFDIAQPVRTVIPVLQNSSLFYSMPCYCEYEDIFSTKLLTFNTNNKKHGIPTIHAIIQLFRASTGQPLSILEAHSITGWRTAGCSAVATKMLVNGTPKILAILGSGHQAKSHFEALIHLYQFTEVRFWNIHKDSAQKLVLDIEDTGTTCLVCDTVQEAVNEADIICTTTSAREPILNLEWVKPGVHINAVGATRFDKQEIHPDLMKRAIVYVECTKAAREEAGDIIQSGVEIFAEIGEVLDGKKVAKREEITIFKSLGMAIEDAVTAALVYKKLQAST